MNKIKPISNYEGFKRLEKSLEKIGTKSAANSKICDVCHRRVRAWRIVPAKFGTKLGKTMASRKGALTGRFAIVCDAGPDSCAAMLTRSGVAAEGVRHNEAEARLGKLGIILSALALVCCLAGCAAEDAGVVLGAVASGLQTAGSGTLGPYGQRASNEPACLAVRPFCWNYEPASCVCDGRGCFWACR